MITQMYLQETFSPEDQKFIATAIDTGAISPAEIKESFVRYMLDKFTGEQLWEYLHEYYDNGLTHQQNYSIFITNFLKTKP